MHFKEFVEFDNPEKKDYDIKSGINKEENSKKKVVDGKYYSEHYSNPKYNYFREGTLDENYTEDLLALMELDDDENLMVKYGLTPNEFYHPNAEVIEKIRKSSMYEDEPIYR